MEARIARVTALAFIALTLLLSAPTDVAALEASRLPPELQRVRAALDKYRDPVRAVHDGYFSTLGCVTYPKPGGAGQVAYGVGTMGVHFLNIGLVGQPLDAMKPQLLIYEPQADGKLVLVGAEWFVPATPDATTRPRIFDRDFDGPMQGHEPLMPEGPHHYDLHVWLWRENPLGLFAPTNPKVKCPRGRYTFEETAPKIVPVKR